MIHSDFEFEFNGHKGFIPAGNITRVITMIEVSALTAMQTFFWAPTPLKAPTMLVAKGVEILCAQGGVRGVKQEELAGLLLKTPHQQGDCLNLLSALMAMLIPPDADAGNVQAAPEPPPKKTTRKAS